MSTQRSGNQSSRRLCAGLAAVLLTLLVQSARAGETDAWPRFRGPRGDGIARVEGLPLRWTETANVRWKTPLHDRGWSSPVVWGNQVWLTTATADGKRMYAMCVDRENGAIAHDIKVLDVAEPRFRHDLNSYASPTPAIEEGRVYVHFGSYLTACLDTATGRELWRRTDLPCDHFRGPGSSPILFEGLLIAHFDGFDHQYVVALDKKTGKTVWRTNRSNDFGGTENGDFKKAYSTPVVVEAAGRLQLLSQGSRAAFAYDPRIGVELWRVRFNAFSSTGMPMFGGGLVYVNTGFGKADLWAVRPGGSGDVTDSHVVWKTKRGVPSKPSTLLLGDLIFMVNDSGVASCVNALDGETIWTHRIGGEHSASPLAAGGAIYFFSHDGEITVIRAAKTYKPLAVNRLEGGFMSSPAVVGRALYLRTKTHLYRIENDVPPRVEDR